MPVAYYDCVPNRDTDCRAGLSLSDRDNFAYADPLDRYPNGDTVPWTDFDSLPNVFYNGI